MPAGRFFAELLRQQVVGKERRGTARPPLRRKLTGELPPWGAGRDRAGQQAGATLVAGATNVAPSQLWLGDKWYRTVSCPRGAHEFSGTWGEDIG